MANRATDASTGRGSGPWEYEVSLLDAPKGTVVETTLVYALTSKEAKEQLNREKGWAHARMLAARTNGRRLVPGLNDLATCFPHLSHEILIYDPHRLKPGSGRHAPWLCGVGHVWIATVATRVNGHGCPFCTGRYASPHENDLLTTHPKIAITAVDRDPRTMTATSKFYVRWRCPIDNHEWDATPKIRVKTGCPVCGMRVLVVGVNDLATTHPRLAAELVDEEPTNVCPGADGLGSRRFLWRCSNGHYWKCFTRDRIDGAECPKCEIRTHERPAWATRERNRLKRSESPTNDYAAMYPQAAMSMLHPDPKALDHRADCDAVWLCRNGHTWISKASHRANQYPSGCPHCAARRVTVGFTDLATTHPHIAARMISHDPRGFSFSSKFVVTWRCLEGHEYEHAIVQATARDSCPVCSGKRVEVGFNDLQTTHPELATQLVSHDPTSISRGSMVKCEWQCERGHRWISTPNTRTNSYRQATAGCPYCMGNLPIVGETDLRTRFPEIAAEIVGVDPTTVSAFSTKRAKWRCSEGHEYIAAISNRTSNFSACPECNPGGYNQVRPGVFYFVHGRGIYKGGISNVDTLRSRLQRHYRQGLTETDVLMTSDDGTIPPDVEGFWLSLVKSRSQFAVTKRDLFDGHTEALHDHPGLLPAIMQFVEDWRDFFDDCHIVWDESGDT